MTDADARLTELELRFMEQQATIDALDGVVREQDLELVALRRDIQRLQQILAGGQDDEGGADGE